MKIQSLHFYITVTFYCLILQASLSANTIEIKPVIVINKGVGGNNTRQALARFQHDVLDIKPDYMIIYFGMNDSVNSHALVPLAEYKSNMQKMLSKAKKKEIVPIIITLNPIIESYVKKRHPNHPAENLSTYQAQYNQVIYQLAKENNIQIVDLRKLVMESVPSLEDRISLLRNKANSNASDGVHLTAKGYKKFVELFIPVFRNKIQSGDIVVCFGDSITYGAHMNGAGTIYGETYPAWLSIILNKLAGIKNIPDIPPLPSKIDPTKIANCGFEEFSDTVHPDSWKLWNIPGQQEGKLLLLKNGIDAKEGKNYLHISNQNKNAPAYLANYTPIITEISGKYQMSYSIRGQGKIIPQLTLYTKDSKQTHIPDKLDIWTKADSKWKTSLFNFFIPENITKIRIKFRVIGEIDLDNIILTHY